MKYSLEIKSWIEWYGYVDNCVHYLSLLIFVCIWLWLEMYEVVF